VRPWSESSVTWNLAQTGSAWSTAGCNGVGTDRSGTAAASVRINQAGGALTLDLPASLIAGWLAAPATNQGLLLRPQPNSGGATVTYAFASAEFGIAAARPTLTITYTLPTGRFGGLEGEAPVDAAPAASAGQVLADDAAATLAAVPAGQRWVSYYFLDGERVALREQTATTNVVYYLLSDHLGSTSVVTNSQGGQVTRQWYYPFGEPRAAFSSLPTDRRFTGQRSEEAALGSLYDFVARPYSPYLNPLDPD
jgi:hypothetical protein